MGSHGHSAQSVYSGRVCLLRLQQALLILSHALLPTGLATMHRQQGKGLPRGARESNRTDKMYSPAAYGNELLNLLWI